jgi:hypothetical protein
VASANPAALFPVAAPLEGLIRLPVEPHGWPLDADGVVFEVRTGGVNPATVAGAVEVDPSTRELVWRAAQPLQASTRYECSLHIGQKYPCNFTTSAQSLPDEPPPRPSALVLSLTEVAQPSRQACCTEARYECSICWSRSTPSNRKR